MRVAVLSSGSGGNLATTLRLAAADPSLLDVALVVSDVPTSRSVELARKAGLPVIARDFVAECGRASAARGERERAEYATRARRFHDALDRAIERFERDEGSLDLIVLAYRRWIHGRLLDRFRVRMINQHPGDLCALDELGARVLRGNNPVFAALSKGTARVRTTTFLVDEGHDTGAIVCQGPWLSCAGRSASQAGADELESAQKLLSDRPSLICALSVIGTGALSIDADRRGPDGSPLFWLDRAPLPFGGIDLDAAAHEDARRDSPAVRRACEAIDACAALADVR